MPRAAETSSRISNVFRISPFSRVFSNSHGDVSVLYPGLNRDLETSRDIYRHLEYWFMFIITEIWGVLA